MRYSVNINNTYKSFGLIAIAEAPKLLLAGTVPHVEDDGATVGVERERVHLHAHGG